MKKVVALDRFLREFINAEQPSGEGDSQKGYHEFSDMKSVSNLLAGELLVDVHHVCSTSDDDDTSHLQQYLLLGRGATLLKVLNTIGVQGVSCNRELGDLLATLLPLCCKFPCSKDVEYAGGSLAPVDACFKHLRTWKVAKPITKFPTLTEVRSSSTTHNVDEHTHWPAQRAPVRKSHSSNSDDSSESDVDTTHPRLLSGFRLRHPSMLHAGASAEVLGVFPGLLHDQPDEDGIKDPTYENTGFSVKLHPLELCLTMLELMQSLCQGDSVELAQTRVVSFIVLPHLSHLLFSLVSETLVENLGLTEGWTLLQQLLLIRSLTRATLAVMSHASVQPNGVSYLGSHGCVLQLIEAAKVVAKCLPQPRVDQVTWSDSDQEMLLFVDDVMYGLLMLFHTMLQSIPLNPSILSSSLKLLNELCDHGLQLVQVVLVHWERLLSSVEPHPVQHTLAKEHIIGIVSSVGHVMSSLKKAKVDYIHMMKCLKRRHKSCDFSHYTHHHHDILGISSSAFADYLVTMSDSYGSMEMISSESSEMNGQAECMLAVLGEFILQVLMDAQTKLLQIRLLACIEEAGLCCCMAPGRIQRHLLTHLEKQTPGVRSYVLCVLTKVLMDFCGGAAQIQKNARTICAVCRDLPASHLNLAPGSRDHTQPRHEASDSALSSSEASLHESGKVCHPKWHCLRQFLPLLRHKDEALSVQVTQHVLRLISQASPMFKQQLFHSVFLPMLRQLKKCYLDPGGEGTDPGNDPSETVIQYCLSALPLLLHSKVAQDLFHNVGGVRLLQALIKIRSLRKCVLKVLQVLIILEERSCWEVFPQETVILATESTEPSYTEDPRVLTEEADSDTMSVCDAFMEIVLTHTPEQQEVNTEGAAQEEAVPEKTSSLLELPSDRHDLSIMCDVWNACATLFPSSQHFQQKFLQSNGHDRALDVLRSALHKVVNATEDNLTAILPGWDRGSPFQCWLSLIESTLFVCLSYSGSKLTFGTEELNREKLLLEVQEWLQHSRSLSGLARRAVCDTLLSCATSHRNMRDIVSNHTFAVMHLRIDDSDEREVSEVSDYWSTAKESETCHTEQGYEADSEFTPDEHTKLEGDREGRQTVPLPPRPLPTHVMHHPELTRLVLELLVLTPEAEPADSPEEHTDSGASSQLEPADIKASSHKQSSEFDPNQAKPTDTVRDEHSTVSKSIGSPDSVNDGVLAHLLLRLISYAKQSAHIASTLYNQGLVGVILEGIKKTVGSGPQQTVERQLLLDLFLLISQHAFSSRELSAFLDLFKNTALPTGSLLSAATSLAEAFQLKPTYILVFPVVRTSPTAFELSTRSISSDILAASLRPVEGEEPQSEYVELLRSSNVQEALDLDTVGSLDSPPSPQLASNKSPLYCAPIQMNVHDSLRWPRSDRSFSISLWLQMEGGAKGDASFMRRSRRVSRAAVMEMSAETSLVNPEVVLPARLRAAMSRSATSQLWSERCLHIASLGSERQRVELWADPDTGSLICRRLAQPEEGEEVVAGQACLAGLLGFGCWEHLAVNYQEFNHEGTRRAKLSAYVNGCYSREATFDLQSRGHRKKKAAAGSTDSDSVTLLMVGHSLSPKEAAASPVSWHLGNLMLFKGSVLSQSVSFHLYTLGPDCCSVSQCDSADLPTDYPRHITRDLLHQTTLNLDLFTTNQNVSLQPLRENMVAMYAPAQLATFNLYRPTSTPRSNTAPTQSARNHLNHQPQAVAVHFLAGVDAQAHTGLGDAVKEIGGIGVFLYLFAWVVEHSSREKEQAQALKLLFTLVSRNPHHAREFSDMGGYSMLAKVLGSDKCIIGYDLLKVLLDAMLTRPMLRYDSATQEWVLQKETTALIRDVRIVSELLLAWRVWDRGPVHVWHMAFTALEYLLQDEHPHQQFNARQLQNIGIVDSLLLICLERIQDSCPSLPVPICQSILNLTAGMLGHPPDVHIIMTICDFLLLIHPAASTYINHTPDEFYFIQKWAAKKSPRRLSGMFSAAKTSNIHSLTSTPIKRTPITSADSLSDDSQSYEPENHLSRSQSLPTVAESPLSGQDEQGSVVQSQTVSDCDAVDNARYLSATVELDNLVPALIIDQNRDMASDVVTAAEPDDQPKESTLCSSRKTSENSEPVRFYVETGSERSSTSSATGVPDVSSIEARNRTNVNNGQAVSTTQSNSHSGINSHQQHGDTSEDENGNSTVSGSYRVSRLAARGLFHSTPTIDQLSSSAPDCLVAEGDIDPEVWAQGKGNSSFSVASDRDSPVEEEERGLVHISVGLLDLLCNILVLLPENDLSKILGVILKPETLLVMAHHQAPEIRKSIVRLLDMFFHRANLKQKEQFMRQQGFHLLASQLYQHAATQPLLEACFMVLFGRPHALEDDFEVAQLVEMSRVQKQAVIPILALLESAASNTPVAHFTLVLLIKLLEQVDCLMPVMLENALTEVLCNMLSAVHASPPRLNDAGADERYVLIEDLQHFFAVIAERAFSTSGVAYYQHFEDSLALLHALEISEVARYGLESEEVGNIRNIRAHVLRTVFDYVNGRLENSGSGQLLMSTKVVSLLSFLPAKRPTAEGSSVNADSSSPPSGGSRSTSRRSAPANMSRMHQSSSGSYYSDSPGSTSDWSTGGVRSPSVTTKGFHGNKKMEIGQGELLERFKKLVVLASEFVMYSVPRRGKQTYVEQRLSRLVQNSIEVISFENDFARFLCDFLIRGIVVGMERSFFQRKTLHSTIMWQAKDVLRIQFSSLVAHLSLPTQPLGQRLFIIELLCSEVKKQEVLKQVINIANLGQKLVFYLYELLVSHLEQLTKAYRNEVDDLISTLEQLNLRVLRIGYKISANTRAMIDEDQKIWQMEGRRERSHWLKKHDAAKLRLLSRVDTFARRISGCAMELTQTVVNAQNAERRKLVEHVKAGMSQRLSVKKSWQQIIQQLSHERAVWHCPESYPTSWQLDPTEGPCRVRRRTQRCHLSIGKRYLDEGYQEKLDAETKTPPLSYLFDEDVMTSDSAALIYRLHTNEKIQHTCRCTSVTPSSETPGELLIGQNSVYFVGDEAIMDANYTQVLLGNKDLLSMTLPNEDVTEIHKRWYQLRDIGLEVFLTNGKTSLLAFENIKERDSVYRLLLSQELPSLIQNENLTAIQQMWMDRRMTNFEYLTHLNKMAGRSFNDLMQYPVFPFVLAKYDEKMLDLDAHSTFRNLAKPISVQHKEREEKYIENYKWLALEKERLVELEPTLYAPDPYHYGSHYSNSGTVLHFLVRVPPFTQMFLVYQDKNFDLPDRTFHSLHTAWRLASEQSTTDVKELIPEFFCLPEFLTNTEGFAFGARQDGVKVWDVLLPEWCGGDPRIFTLIHRQALESDYVTQHLPAWIDLVFGIKQTGKAAIDAINVFHPATYFGTDVDRISDPVRRTAIKTMIKTYGQTPKQLFKTAHPTAQAFKSGKEKCPAMKSVTGLRWGNYVGSPDQPDPVMVWSQNHGSLISSLVALPTDDVFGLGLNSCLLVMYSKEKGVTAVNTTDVLWAAIISWNHADGIVRVQNRRNAPAVNLLHWGLKERVTCCAAVPDCRLLFFGSTSGVVTVFNTKFNADKVSNLQVFGRRQCLYGHSGAVTDMYVCKPYSVLVTTSTDSTAIIWDLNRLCYVRTITDHKASVQLVSVSDTSGDIATVSHAGRRSVLKLHTINAALVGSVRSSRTIHCLAFSNAPEGRAVNIIAGGLSNGTVRFWSTWDMAVVRDITWDKFTKPIASLTFTHNSQRLYAADVDGTVAVFEKPKSPSSKTKPVNFISFL